MSATHCLNCQTPLEGKYCHACGQKAATHRLSMKHFLAHEVVHGLWHVDGSFLFTLKQSVTRPGNAAVEYIAGKRRKYFNLVTLLLILSGISVFLRSKLDPAGTQSSVVVVNSGRDTPTVSGTVSDGVFPQAGLTYTRPEPDSTRTGSPVAQSRPERVARLVQDWTQQNQKWILLGFIPLISVTNRIVFKRTRYNYAENIVVAAFFLSGLLVLAILSTLLSAGITSLIPGRITLVPLFSLVFLAFAYWQTFRRHYTVGGWLWRGLAAFFLFFFLFVLVAGSGFAIVALVTEGTSVFSN